MTKIVALDRCDEYKDEIVFQSVKRLFELVPPPDVKNKIVLLKPNILYPKKPEAAVCTHPVVVGAVVKAFCELGAKKVIVGESPAITGSVSAAKTTGMYEQVVKNGGEWVDFHESVTLPFPEGVIVKQFDVAKQLTEADVVVSLSKLKSHQFMRYTGAMKNLFGLMVGLDKAKQHYRFPDKKDFGVFLTDLVCLAKPSYAVMDAIVGMEGPGGPGGGDPIKLGFLAASDNILALDWKCSSLVGYNPHNISNLEDALKRGIWLDNPEEIQVVGASEDDCRCTSFKIVKDPSEKIGKLMPKLVDKLASFLFTKTPYFNANKCKKCKRCAEICPAHLITMTGKHETAKLTDKAKCLHCFCCHEICPFGAIKLKKF